MEGKKRTIFLVLIAVVIVVAVFSSFGLNVFAPDTPEIRLPAVTDSNGGEASEGDETDSDRYTRILVTPETVQDVIRTMVPIQPESYSRTVTVSVNMGDGTTSATTNWVWVDHGWTKVESVWPNGTVEHTIVGEGKVYRWYSGDQNWSVWEGDVREANLAQRIPTYEDVLALEQSDIVAAGYEEKDGVACVYAETGENETGSREKYWVSVEHGLLVAAEASSEDEVLLSMSAQPVELPAARGAAFVLPDGTMLHDVSG